MDLNYIKKLVKLVEDSNISEIEVEQNDSRIKVTKNAPAPVYTPAPQVVAHAAPAAAPVLAAAEPKVAKAETPAAAPQEVKGHEVKSPIVGTFYRAAKPDAEAFVKEGDRVSAGQTLCIVEAMKLMNEIESDVSGIVRKVLVENGRAVEYGQPLFIIEV